MNKIEAIIRPEKLNAVKDALADAGVLPGINVAQVTGRGAQRGIEVGGPRGVAGSYVVDMLPKVKLETVVTRGGTRGWRLTSSSRTARTGNIGDGKIFRYAGGQRHSHPYRRGREK